MISRNTARTLAFCALLSGCIGATDDGPAADEDFGHSTAAVTCDPRMTIFPVRAEHNIGYDMASCGSGTCEISCPDRNANSDWQPTDHQGIDIFAFRGAPLVAVADGTVVRVGTPSSTSGLRVRLRDACGWEYYYGHLDSVSVREGQVVSAGEVLGTMGNSGTGGVHLHFNISPDGEYSNDINPFALLQATSGTACTTCTATCVSSTVIRSADCSTGDCAFYGASCVDDELGARCVAAFCPPRGTAQACTLDGDTIITCNDGAIESSGSCGAFGARCVDDDLGARCASVFCEARGESSGCLPSSENRILCSDGRITDTQDCAAMGARCVEGSCVGPGTDAGPSDAGLSDAGTDMGARDVGGVDSGHGDDATVDGASPDASRPDGELESGCGCSLYARGSTPGALGFALLLLTAGRRRMRGRL